jgi:hypothetical protein
MLCLLLKYEACGCYNVQQHQETPLLFEDSGILVRDFVTLGEGFLKFLKTPPSFKTLGTHRSIVGKM